jgi:murein DD-endopeptidase MepM/ murein hydrolase activator NlpD
MPKQKREISILFLSHHGPRKFALKLSEGAFYAVLMGIAAFLVIFGFLFFSYGDLYLRTVRLTRRNVQLEAEHSRVVALENEVRAMRELDRKVRMMLGEETKPPPLDLSASGSETRTAGPGSDIAGAEDAEFSGPEIAALFNQQEIRRRSLPSIWPVQGWVTQEFRGSLGARSGHGGVDIAAPQGAPVVAAADGIVTFADWDEIYGNLVTLDHGLGFQTRYGHNSQVIAREGQTVKRGDILAFVGSTGRSTAPHLHYEVLRDGLSVDPRTYVVD